MLLIILCFLVSVYAESEPLFEGGEELIVAPPTPPEEGMEITEKRDIVLELRDYDSKNLIKGIHANLEIVNMQTNERISTLRYVSDDGLVKLRLYEGEYDIILKVDKVETNGRDNYITFDQRVDNDIERTVYLFSVGSLMGNVYDKAGKIVPGAQIKLQCSGNYGESQGGVSDKFGSFSAYWLPIGLCKVSAKYGNNAGHSEVEIKKGELSEVDINLSKGVLPRFNFTVLIIMIVLGVMIALIGIKFVNKKGKEEKSKEEKIEISKPSEVANTKKELSSRTEDVINTLKEKEKNVVEFLLKNGNKGTQSKVRYATGIPKTSLARVLVSLELKKIVKVEKIGKLKKIELTPWFLGKD